MEDINELKKAAAVKAVDFVMDGMVVGLGTGSTAKYAIEGIADRLKNGRLKNVRGIPSSIQSEKLALELEIPLITFQDESTIDVTIDGADEADITLNLIKGGGGALLREKVLAQASRRNIIIVDESKLSPAIGSKWPLPIEVVPFALHLELSFLKQLNGIPEVRTNNNRGEYKTDQNNLIIDCNFGKIKNADVLADRLNSRAGIVEHGLFIGSTTDLIVAHKNGIAHFTRETLSEQTNEFRRLILIQ